MCGVVFVLSNEQMRNFALIFIAKVESIKTNRKLFLAPFLSGMRKEIFRKSREEFKHHRKTTAL